MIFKHHNNYIQITDDTGIPNYGIIDGGFFYADSEEDGFSIEELEEIIKKMKELQEEK